MPMVFQGWDWVPGLASFPVVDTKYPPRGSCVGVNVGKGWLVWFILINGRKSLYPFSISCKNEKPEAPASTDPA